MPPQASGDLMLASLWNWVQSANYVSTVLPWPNSGAREGRIQLDGSPSLVRALDPARSHPPLEQWSSRMAKWAIVAYGHHDRR